MAEPVPRTSSGAHPMNHTTLTRAMNVVTGLVARTHDRRGDAPRPWTLPSAHDGQRVTFRFGLTGRRWGAPGPAVLVVPGGGAEQARQFRYVIESLVGSGHQVFALDATAPDGQA